MPGRVRRGMAPCLMLLALGAFTAFSQDLPKEIRGYKVHRAKVTAASDEPNGPRDAGERKTAAPMVRIARPRVTDIGLSGVALELSANISTPKQRGKIDLVSFHGITANGIPMEVEDHVGPIELTGRSNDPLPLTLRAKIRNTDVLRAAFRELIDSKDRWSIRGRVFVFGRFKRFGFTFKRVIPVDLDLQIANPLR